MLYVDLMPGDQAKANARFMDAGPNDNCVYQFDLDGQLLSRRNLNRCNKATIAEIEQVLAREAACADLESYTLRDSEGWHNLDSLQGPDVYWVYRAVLYLHLCGLLERHPDKPRRVRIKRDQQPAQGVAA